MKSLEPAQWKLIASLLSLDAVTPFHERIGLAWPDKAAFVLELRKVIVAQRSPQPGLPLDQDLAQMIQAAFGPSALSMFQHWATGVFMQVHADQPEWAGWHLAFLRWVLGSRNNALLPVSSFKPTIEKRFRELADPEPLQKDIEKVKAMPLSPWDIEMCVEQGFDPADTAGDFFNPVAATFDIFATQTFFKTVAVSFDDRTRKYLHQEAQRMLEEMEVWLPGPLPSIESMLRMLP